MSKNLSEAARTLEISKSVKKKLTKNSGGSEVISALISGALLFLYVVVALELFGALAFFMWCAAGLQVLSMLYRAAGWKNVVLTNEEQAYLIKNYKE